LFLFKPALSQIKASLLEIEIQESKGKLGEDEGKRI
jgi:hypothetical protein